jgi:polysaccharide export outer membrane protein
VFFVPAIMLGAQDSGSKGRPSSPAAKVAQRPDAAPAAPSEEFIIGCEDVLSINVWKEPEVSSPKVVVRPDGQITLPLINEIQATGLTARQLQNQIGERLKEFLEAPLVNVVVLEIRSQTVYILGQVFKAGAYPLGSPTTVLELIAKAGSFTELAKTKKIVITRKQGNNQTQLHFNYEDFVEGKNLQQNILLKSGDVVIVP